MVSIMSTNTHTHIHTHTHTLRQEGEIGHLTEGRTASFGLANTIVLSLDAPFFHLRGCGEDKTAASQMSNTNKNIDEIINLKTIP